MSSIPSQFRNERIAAGRVWWVTLLTAALAIVANGIVRLLTVDLLKIAPIFAPLTWGPFIFFTLVGVLGASVVYTLLGRFTRRPISLFRIIAIIVLVLSFLPDIGLLTSKPPTFPGTTVAGVVVLLVMHVLVAIICIGMFTNLAREK